MAADGPRIALIKLSSLGDVIHALPVAATLRAARPAARLTWIAERREATLLRAHPALDEVIVADTRGWRRARTLPAAVPSAWFHKSFWLAGLIFSACRHMPMRSGGCRLAGGLPSASSMSFNCAIRIGS